MGRSQPSLDKGLSQGPSGHGGVVKEKRGSAIMCSRP